MSKAQRVFLAIALIAVAAIAALLWRSGLKPASQPPSVPAAASAPVETVRSASAPSAASEPPVRRTIEAPPSAAPLAAADIGTALTELLGRKAVESFFQTDDFARRFVATVDNLGRSHAPPRLWPVNPTPGRFAVEQRDGASVIAADNGLRYTPFVLLVETIDIARAVDLYVRMYPELQKTYEELGYPRGYFNDRLIEVIDQLLATPDAPYPVKVDLTEVKGPIPSQRPWVRYRYADPVLESLSAGQRILMRVGSVNERRLRAKLLEIRKELMKRATVR